MKKILSLILAMAMLLSMGTVAFADDYVAKLTDKNGNETYYTSLAEAFAAAVVKDANNSTIEILADVNLENTAWTPVYVDGQKGVDVVTVIGNNKTITKLSAPLFHGGFAGGCGIKISDLTIADSNIVSTNGTGSGAFIEYVDAMDVIELKNCHFTNSTLSGSRTGGLVGYTAGYDNQNDGPVKTYVNIENCSVTGCEINATGSAGGIVGHSGANAWTFSTIKACKVENTSITSTDDGSWRVGIVTGTANVGEITVENVTESGNTLSQTGKDAPTTTNLIGRFVSGGTGELVIDGVEYTEKLVLLPTATVTSIEAPVNVPLTFALNFLADEASPEQLACYGEWYADFVLTVNKDVTFNANGGADGYLAGEYGTYGWISVPFTDFTVKANTPIKIMDTAAKLLGQGGLKLTYNDVYAGVKSFNCGVFFTKEFREANPDLEVNLSLKMFNKVNEEESYDIGPVYSFKVPENEIDSIGMGKMADGSASYFQTNLYDVSALNNLTVELWSDDVKIGETTWAKEYPVRTEKDFLTCAALLTGSDEYWNTTWYYKNEALVPTKSVLKIDGEVADEWAYAGTANENITDSWNVNFPGIESAAAKIGDKKFATLQMALDAANTDDVVEVTKDIVLDLQNATHLSASDYAGVYYKGSKSFTLDLGGHTITAGEGVNNDVLRFSNINGIAKNTITVQNGTVISPATTWQAIDAGVGDGSDTGTILNLKNLTINSNRGGACAVRSRMGNVINITDTTINTVNGGGVYVPSGKAELTNVNITVTGDPAVGGYSPAIGACVSVSDEGEAIINSGNYVNEQVNDYNDEYTTYIMNSGGKMTIKGGTFTGGGKGMLGVAGKDAAGTLTIEGGYFKPNEALVYSEGYGKETVAVKGGEFTVDPTAYLATGYETTVIADGWKVVNAEEAKTEADTAYIQFKEVEAEEGTLKYEIVVVGANEEVINRLTTADLSLYFNADPINDNVKMAYKLKAADDITLTKPAADRYAFNFDGINTPSKTDNKIVLGTIEVSGYGTFSMGIKTADTNIVNSTTLYDNLVTTFVVGGDTDNDDKTGKLVVNEDLGNGLVGSIDNKLNAAPKRELTINVKFPNTVYDQAAAYMDMTVTISGGDLESAIVKNLGKATGEAISYVIEENLTKDFTYNVTIEGAGYRTYDCAVKMTGDKTLTFWNNVRTGKLEVEEGKTETATEVTFLAGDIVKDNNINIYDLSAVVSYFATNAPSLADKWDYAKYDLNRDGKIDSKDVAYILVSWGK